MGTVPFAVRIPKTNKAQIKPTLFQPLNILSIEWNHKANTTIQRLQNTHILHPHTSLNYQPDKSVVASFLSEVLHHSLQHENQGDLYTFVETSLMWFDSIDHDYANFHLVFLIKLARLMGFEPNTDHAADRLFFDLVSAEYTTHQPLHNYYLRHTDSQHIPLFLRLQYHNMHLVSLSHEQRFRVLRIIVAYYQMHIPSFPRLQSLAVLQELC